MMPRLDSTAPSFVCRWTRWDSPLDPLRLFDALSRSGEPLAFFPGGPDFGEAGRYAIFALAPERRCIHREEDPRDPFDRLRIALRETCGSVSETPSIPFPGGWAGFFSYDILHRIERIPHRALRDHGFPLLDLAFYREALVYDRAEKVWTATRLLRPGEPRSDADARLAERRAHVEAIALGGAERHVVSFDASAIGGELERTFTREAYETAVARILDRIAAGEIYQVNLAQRFAGRRILPVETIALRLFTRASSPFGAFLRRGRRAIVSTSPERFLRVVGREVETWPIKGTRPRGATPEEDASLREALLASGKEKAELTMITDLLRNDLGRVCCYGSVTVPEPRRLESFSTVHHTRSTVRGVLREDADLADLFRATMPGGSVTGAPKVRACGVIEAIEPVARGPYCGAIGWIGADGRADLGIAIRTVTVEGERLGFHVGSGIVAESDPGREYDETLHKARGIFAALGLDASVIGEA